MFAQLSNSQLRTELGERLRALRLTQSTTQADLARRAGISRPTLSALERGHEVSLDTFLSVLRALNLVDGLALTIPLPAPSPIEALEEIKSTKGPRQRARSPRTPPSPKSASAKTTGTDASRSQNEPGWTWGDQSDDAGETK